MYTCNHIIVTVKVSRPTAHIYQYRWTIVSLLPVSVCIVFSLKNFVPIVPTSHQEISTHCSTLFALVGFVKIGLRHWRVLIKEIDVGLRRWLSTQNYASQAEPGFLVLGRLISAEVWAKIYILKNPRGFFDWSNIILKLYRWLTIKWQYPK